MQTWYKYSVVKDTVNQNNVTSHLDYVTISIPYPSVNDRKRMNFESASSLTQNIVSSLEVYFKKNYDRKVISIGCAEADHERLFLMRNPKLRKYWTLADFDKRSGEYLAQVDPDLDTAYFDVLSDKPDKAMVGKFDVAFIPGIIYLFDDVQMNIFFNNISSILKSNGSILLCHRSLETFWTRVIHHFLVPMDYFFSSFLRKVIRKEAVKISKLKHGYIRSYKEVADCAKKHGFQLQNINKSCFGMDFTARLPLLSRFKIAQVLGRIFGRNLPYLSIMEFKKI